jgi:RsiW-degrading membrane proteinase PrsW (M82 family)
MIVARGASCARSSSVPHDITGPTCDRQRVAEIREECWRPANGSVSFEAIYRLRESPVPISITCSGCGKKLKAKESLLGRTLPCPGCGTKVTVGSDEDDVAAMLLDDAAPRKIVSPPERPTRVERTTTVDRPSPPRPAPKKLKPIRSDEPPTWLRHLHWLLALSLIPLALSLLLGGTRGDYFQRYRETLEELPKEEQIRIEVHLARNEPMSLTEELMMLPEHRLKGAFLPRDTMIHWVFTLVAAAAFFAFLVLLASEGSAKPVSLLLVGLFTATVGIVFLFVVQAIAGATQGVVFFPRSLLGIVIWLVQLIGLSYRVALDPESDFVTSFLGFTFGVGLCEEIVKVIPVLLNHYRHGDRTWRGAYLWGLASGSGFGLAEGIIYAADFYNGVSGVGVYFVRDISCVALHAIWAGSSAILVYEKQHWFQESESWLEFLFRVLLVVAVPMVLHGLYDTLLKKDMNALALGVAVLSFGYLAFLISQLRIDDDRAANKKMLSEYAKQRRALN